MLKNKAVIFLAVALFLATNLSAQQEISFEGGVEILANHIEKEKERIFAIGNVEVHYENIKIFADRIELNTETRDVFAEGNVVVQLPDEQLSVEEIRFNLDTMQGIFKRGFGLIQPTVRYEAETIERKAANFYSFHKASITSCTQTNPRWKFSCSKANFKKNNYIEMWNTVLSIKKIPVFYLPYMRYPLGKEKSTGFLTPRLGYSGPKGMFFSQGFYWAMKRNMDATVNFDYYSAKGMGGGLEYRYLFSQGTGGQLNLYYFFLKEPPGEEELPNAYMLRFNHNQPLPFGFGLVTDVDYQSSFDFLREFDNDFRRALVSNRRSEVFLFRYWSHFKFNMRASRFETYFNEINNSVISKDLPIINFSSSQIKLFTPLYFAFSSSFNRWEHGWQWDYTAGRQRRSQSLEFCPQLSLPLNVIPWLNINSIFLTNFNYQFQTFAPNTSTIVDEPMLSSNYAFAVELIGPVFYRIYYGAQNEAKVKHIIEPYFSYDHEGPVAHPERIITPYGFFREHSISYGLTNHIIIKQDEMPREIFTLGVSQKFYLEPEISPLSIHPIDGEIPRFTDIEGYMRFYPSWRYSLDVSAGFNPYFKTFSSLRLGANLIMLRDLVSLGVNWFKSINPYIENVWYNRHQIGCNLGIEIPWISLEAFADIDFNIQERKMLYSGLSIIYKYQCLDFKVELRTFYFRERPETQFRISFGLGNIGKTTDFLGGAEY